MPVECVELPTLPQDAAARHFQHLSPDRQPCPATSFHSPQVPEGSIRPVYADPPLLWSCQRSVPARALAKPSCRRYWQTAVGTGSCLQSPISPPDGIIILEDEYFAALQGRGSHTSHFMDSAQFKTDEFRMLVMKAGPRPVCCENVARRVSTRLWLLWSCLVSRSQVAARVCRRPLAWAVQRSSSLSCFRGYF